MKLKLIALVCLMGFNCFGQQSVNNSSPYISMDFKRYLYVGFDNPIYITTGSYKSLKVSTDNGSIVSAGRNGSYIIKPENTGTATITLFGKGFKKQFVFEVWAMHFPELRLIPGGYADAHGVPYVQSSKGITTVYRPADVEVEFLIDSFTLEIQDSLNTITHVNIGNLWDNVSKEMQKIEALF